MTLNDWLIILSTLVAPLFALQASQFLDRRRQHHEEEMRVFKTLMSSRASNLDPRHVEALNVIDVVFSSTRDSAQIEIRRLWKQYLDHLGDKSYPKDLWGPRRVEYMVELLHSMALHLGFDFDKTHIKNQCYYPEGYGNIESDQSVIRQSLAEILSGKRPLPTFVTNLHNQSPT